MTLILDPDVEQRFRKELEAGGYSSPSHLVAHLLDLAHFDEADLSVRRTELIARLEQSVSQAERGEGVTGEELRARFAARKAAFEKEHASAS